MKDKGKVGHSFAIGATALAVSALSVQAAFAASPYTQRTTHHISLTINEVPGTAMFDDQEGAPLAYRNGYTAINDYHDPSASDQQFFAPGNRYFKLDISGSASDAPPMRCAMYGGKDSSLMTSGAAFFQADTGRADSNLKCATPDGQLYVLTYTDCIQVTEGSTADGRWTYTFTASESCFPLIKNGRKTISVVTPVPFSVTAEQLQT